MKQFDIWLANLNPQKGSEVGKVRPVVIIQTNLLNKQDHPSTLICPITTNLVGENYLRVPVIKTNSGLKTDSEILVDQIRAIDNKRLINKIGGLDKLTQDKLKNRLRLILEL